jgi:hypothetical protein
MKNILKEWLVGTVALTAGLTFLWVFFVYIAYIVIFAFASLIAIAVGHEILTKPYDGSEGL